MNRKASPFFLLGLLCSTLAAEAQYLGYDLGPGNVQGINSSGTVVGTIYGPSGGPEAAFTYSSGVMTRLGTLPAQPLAVARLVDRPAVTCTRSASRTEG